MSFRHRWAAYRDLFSRYRTIWGHFWRQRKSLREGFFNTQEAEFLPAALSLQEKPASSSAKLTARILMALVLALLLWSVWGRIDIVAQASGKVIASSRTKTIAAVEVAAVHRLHVQEGQSVKAGDVLIELDASASDAEHDKSIHHAIEARLQVARSLAMLQALDHLKTPVLKAVAGVPDERMQPAMEQLQDQYRDFAAKLTRLDGEIARYAQALPLAAQRAADYKVLAKEHDVSTHAWLEKEQARVDLQGQLQDAKNQRTALVAQTRKEAHDALTEASKLTVAYEQDARRTGEHSQLLKLTAPVDGTVQQLSVHTVGAAVPAAQPLMLIVPNENQVEVEAFLENKDIGFVHEGQSAQVKIDAFEYTKYGTIGARVSHVSRDAIADEKRGLIYSVKVVLERNYMAVEGRRVPLSAGMSVNVEIKTGTRRVIEYVLSPLMQHQREALRER